MLFCWGSNKFGQLGLGNAKLNEAETTILSDLEGMEIKCLAANGELSAAINSYGELYTWGSSKNGAQVDSSGHAESQNLKLPKLFASKDEFMQVACGKDHMAVVTLDGRLMTMGSNDHSKLGFAPLEKAKHDANSWRYAKNSGGRLNTQSC